MTDRDRTVEDDLSALDDEGGTLRDIAAIDLKLPVPTCPGWTQADLLRHVGKIYRWGTEHVAEGLTERRSMKEIEVPDGDDVVLDWFDDTHQTALMTMARADHEAEVWTFGSDSTVRFWPRRLAHESLIHRWDAEQARGEGATLPPELAVDGIDEFLDLRVMTAGILADADEILHVRAEDANADWSLDPEYPDELGGGFAEGDAHLIGPASDLLLTLWRRIATDSVRWDGDRDAIHAWQERLEAVRL